MDIRQAVSTDSLSLSSLSRDVQRLHAEHHPGILKLPQSEDFAVPFFDEMLADLPTRIFIVEKDEEALGCILCKLIERPETPFTFAMRYLLIDQISVRPNAQGHGVEGHGVGAALIKQAEVLARELNLSRIQLDSWGFNTKAHAFFEKMGFEKFNHRFWKHL